MYTKQTWNTGDVITEEKLNHMEDGIANAGGLLIVNSNYDESTDISTLDKTWKEIYNACIGGINVYVKNESSDPESLTIRSLKSIEYLMSAYNVITNNGEKYSTDSENGYPAYEG